MRTMGRTLQHREILELSIGKWWRFSSYEVAGGFIMPRTGATLERYDPWEDYRSGDESPYLKLIQLIESFNPSSDGTGITLPKENEKPLLDWCGRYGLLGLLPHQTLMAVLAPRWRVGESQKFLVPTQVSYVRTPMRWETNVAVSEDGPEQKELNQKGQIVPLKDRPNPIRPVGVLIQGLGSTDIQWRSFSDVWSQFFPKIKKKDREAFDYPQPLSETFWNVYAESFASFWNAAMVFREVVRSFGQTRIEGDDQIDRTITLEKMEKMGVESVDRLMIAQKRLNLLAQSIGPAIGLDSENTLRQVWPCGSLLASFSMMLLRDLTGGKKYIRTCDHCGKTFETPARQGWYCSSRCRYTAQKRNQRKNAKERKMRNSGSRNTA